MQLEDIMLKRDYRKMKPKHLIPILLCLCLLLAAPAAAEETPQSLVDKITVGLNTPIPYHPYGFTLSDVREAVNIVHSDTSLRPDEKTDAISVACGMDEKLLAWLNAERDEETGEPIYNTRIPVLTPLLAAIGIWEDVPSEPYTEEEGQAHWDAYLYTWQQTYKPTGQFGGVIE